MASNPNDLATVANTFAEEANTLQSLIAQAAGGDAASLGLLQTELQNALALKATYLAQVPDADVSIINAAITQAQTFLHGGTSGTGLMGGSVKLFGLNVPVVGLVLVAGLMYVAMKKGRR